MELPKIYNEESNNLSELQELLSNSEVIVHDVYKSQLAELFEINNPSLIFEKNFKQQRQMYLEKVCGKNDLLHGSWVYYPWRKTLLHILSEDDYYSIRTNRNRELISKEEQMLLRNKSIGFIGLSIGSSSFETMVYSGIGKHFVLADFDMLETSNLNRIKANALDVGLPKLDIAVKRALEVDPYIQIDMYGDGLSENNYLDYLAKLHGGIVFEAIDSLKMKVLLRVAAKKMGIPVVMFTNLGDGIMIDIERYDSDSTTTLFNNRIPSNVIDQIMNDEITKKNINKYVLDLVGLENIPKKAIESVNLIGKELVGRPQLATTVGVSGSLSGYIAKQILLNKRLESGRYIFQFEEILQKVHDS